MIKIRLRPGESLQAAVRRFRRLCERSGLPREIRKRAYYQKPSEQNRRAKLRAIQGDLKAAVFWYRRAKELGIAEAEILLKGIQTK